MAALPWSSGFALTAKSSFTFLPHSIWNVLCHSFIQQVFESPLRPGV